jgi:putative inorganic carbon (HCO3(-)) transporter
MLPLGLAAGALGLAVAPPVLLKRLISSFSLTDSSNAYRVFIWRGSFAMLRDNLLRGIGLGAESFSKVYPEYMIIQTPAPHAHSTFLEFLIEVGLLGFLAMASVFIIWLYDAFKVISARKGKGSARWTEVAVLSATVAAVGGHMLQGIIDYTWYSPKVTAVFWAIVGIGAGVAAAKLSAKKTSTGSDAA